MSDKKLTTHLAELRQGEADERASARDVKAQVEAAHGAVELGRAGLVDAYADADQAVIKEAKLAVKKAEDRVAELAMKAKAADIRVQRATSARVRFGDERARELIEELRQEAELVTAWMAQAVRDLVAADKAWHGVSAQVTQLLARVPNASVRYDAAGDHGYADAVREARRAAQREVRSPLPHWTGVRQDEDEQRVALLGPLKRLRRPTPAQQNQIEQLRHELAATPTTARGQS